MKHKLSANTMIHLAHDAIARVAHDALRTYCVIVYDTPAPVWADAPPAQRKTMTDLVRYVWEHPEHTPQQFHEDFRRPLLAEGWTAGEARCPVRRTHPHLVPYDDLSPKYRSKQAMLFAIVRHLLRPGAATAC